EPRAMVRRDGRWCAERSQIRGLAFGENGLWRGRWRGRAGRRAARRAGLLRRRDRRGWVWYAERTQFPGFPFRENQLRRGPRRIGAAGGEPGGVPVPPSERRRIARYRGCGGG